MLPVARLGPKERNRRSKLKQAQPISSQIYKSITPTPSSYGVTEKVERPGALKDRLSP